MCYKQCLGGLMRKISFYLFSLSILFSLTSQIAYAGGSTARSAATVIELLAATPNSQQGTAISLLDQMIAATLANRAVGAAVPAIGSAPAQRALGDLGLVSTLLPLGVSQAIGTARL